MPGNISAFMRVFDALGPDTTSQALNAHWYSCFC